MIQVRVVGRPKRLFYGWVIVAGTMVQQLLQQGVGFQGFGTFLVPLEQEFGWSKSALTGARSIMQVESGLFGPIEGTLADRFGPRVTVSIGTFVFGLGMVLFGLVHSLWAYYAVFLLMAVGASIGGFIALSVAINNWFRRKRTLALSLSQMGLSLGGIIVVPLLVWTQNEYGWRTAAMGAGFCVWAIGIPCALLMRHSPERYGMLPDGDSPAAAAASPREIAGASKGAGSGLVDFTLREAMRTRAFWCIGLGHGLSITVITAVTIHQFAHMEQGAGLSRAAAATVVTTIGATNIAARLAAGFLGDRMTKRYVAAAGTVAAAVSVVILVTAHTLGQAMAFGVLFGFSWGIRGPMMTSMRGDYFGRAHFGKIVGASSLLTSPGSIMGPLLAGFMADVYGNYDLAFIVLAGISLLGAVMFMLATPPKPPLRLRTERGGSTERVPG